MGPAAQEYVISNVYPVMKQDKVTQSSFQAHGQTLYKWRLFFEGMDGHYVTNRTEGNGPKKGDQVYGIITEDQFGNPTFKSESRPLGQLPSKPVESKTGATSTDLEAKVDHLIAMVESLVETKEHDAIDEPIDLSEIPF